MIGVSCSTEGISGEIALFDVGPGSWHMAPRLCSSLFYRDIYIYIHWLFMTVSFLLHVLEMYTIPDSPKMTSQTVWFYLPRNLVEHSNSLLPAVKRSQCHTELFGLLEALVHSSLWQGFRGNCCLGDMVAVHVFTHI